MRLEDVLHDHRGHVRALVARFHVPDDGLGDPAVLEAPELSLGAPEGAEGGGVGGVGVVGGRAVVDEAEGVLGVVEEADVDGGGGGGERGVERARGGGWVEDGDGFGAVAEGLLEEGGDGG